jgi:hypothetical protein
MIGGEQDAELTTELRVVDRVTMLELALDLLLAATKLRAITVMIAASSAPPVPP